MSAWLHLIRLSLRRKCLLVEALTLMAVTWFATKLLPHRLLTPIYGTLNRDIPTPRPSLSPQQELVHLTIPQRKSVWDIRWALRKMQHHLPWQGTCLPRSLAGSLMLRRRGLPAFVRIGAKHNADGDLKLHAWLTTIEEVRITGVREANGFKVLATYESGCLAARSQESSMANDETTVAGSLAEITDFEGRAA